MFLSNWDIQCTEHSLSQRKKKGHFLTCNSLFKWNIHLWPIGFIGFVKPCSTVCMRSIIRGPNTPFAPFLLFIDFYSTFFFTLSKWKIDTACKLVLAPAAVGSGKEAAKAHPIIVEYRIGHPCRGPLSSIQGSVRIMVMAPLPPPLLLLLLLLHICWQVEIFLQSK